MVEEVKPRVQTKKKSHTAQRSGKGVQKERKEEKGRVGEKIEICIGNRKSEEDPVSLFKVSYLCRHDSFIHSQK